uniref:Reverse transcriptase domain-containing protein n=1 Tax=Pediastrum duplex TaxID=3105 RepID=A0A1W5RMG7_PEDDU|nr:hypothetical protein [Pediastrum duplex]AQU64404.1 hypothetical protein [Pediastrum duplex]
MVKQRYPGINKKRKELEEQYKETLFKPLKTVNALAAKSANNPQAKFNNLIRIISSKGVLYQAIGNISGKEGALTQGLVIDKTTVDSTSNELVERLSKEIKNGTYRFKPIRRVYMDKSGKNPVTEEQMKKLKDLHAKGKITMDQIKELKARPLGISSFPDKVVQESIRIVLNAIYEPEFARINTNFGFRPKYGCADAILQIQNQAKSMDYAIEGDIKGAFDNVNHKKLIEILEKKIKDTKLLKLIYGGLKCGVMFLSFRQDSEFGTVQGSVLSPLLYNIYFHEFDKYIITDFERKVQEINTKENRKDKPINKFYNSISKKKSKLALRKKLQAVITYKNQENIDINKLQNLQKELSTTLKEYKELDKQQKKIPAIAKSRQTIRFTYHRYADDWVLFTNAELSRVQEWKQIFAEWISNNLELTLSPEKTKITNLNEGRHVKFLGYQLRKATKRTARNLRSVGSFKINYLDIVRRIKRTKEKLTNTGKIVYKSRTVNPTLIVSWDRDRVLTRMVNNGFIKKVGKAQRGKAKTPWTALREPEIINRYNYIIRGYVNYYATVNKQPTDIIYLWYLLKFSCAHTLAQKYNSSLRKIFKRFGKDMSIRYMAKIEKLEKNGEKTITKSSKIARLLNWDDVMQIIRNAKINTLKKIKSKQSISLTQESVDNICNVKVNWRTAYKLSKHCAICGNTEGVEYHHVRHIRIGKVSGFLQVMKQLNRKQIPCCLPCHDKIHAGLYNSLPLSSLYDEELIII